MQQQSLPFARGYAGGDGDFINLARAQALGAAAAAALREDPARDYIAGLLQRADIRIDGERPWDIRVHEPAFFARTLAQGSLGFGDAYVEGWWDCEDLDGMFERLLPTGAERQVRSMSEVWMGLRSRLLNLQLGRRAYDVGERHYDLGNDLYRAMLGRRLVYSCGYWRDADTLDAAQEAKLDLVCRKLGLRPGMRVLDIGCGWGEALKYAAERYGVTGVGVTVSGEQAELARELCAGHPIEIRLQDYRETEGRYDRIFSIGMFEHVGPKNHRAFFELARRCLVSDGLLLLHTIGSPVSNRHTDPWIDRHIFPNSVLPSAAQITRTAEPLFQIEDWHNFGADYDRTLRAWRDNFDAAWPALAPRYGEPFRRMWRFYLSSSMALFRTRLGHLWQIVFSPEGVRGGYVAPR